MFANFIYKLNIIIYICKYNTKLFKNNYRKFVFDDKLLDWIEIIEI